MASHWMFLRVSFEETQPAYTHMHIHILMRMHTFACTRSYTDPAVHRVDCMRHVNAQETKKDTEDSHPDLPSVPSVGWLKTLGLARPQQAASTAQTTPTSSQSVC